MLSVMHKKLDLKGRSMQLRKLNLFTLISLSVMVTGCAMSMPPKEFMGKFPAATESKFYTKLDANTAVNNGTCKKLILNRQYSAGIGATVDGDLDNAAQGVDGWVASDGGNAFSLNNFEWVDLINKTQLVVYFDTMSCKQLKFNQCITNRSTPTILYAAPFHSALYKMAG